MNFFIIINNLYFSLLIIFPFFSLSQNYVDDIYYSDSEVNYDFLDIEVLKKVWLKILIIASILISTMMKNLVILIK